MSVAEGNTPRYLSLADAGTIASLSERTLRRAIKAGTLRAHYLGRTVRIELGELRRWIEADGAAADAVVVDVHRKGHRR
jgi:excisionase family DNA binding protein